MAFEMDNITQTNQGSELDLDLLLIAEQMDNDITNECYCVWFPIEFLNLENKNVHS